MARQGPTPATPPKGLTNVVSIHFPGVLRDAANPSNALAALGGEQAVATTVVSVSRLSENKPTSQGANIGASASASRFAERRRLLSVPSLNLSLRPGDASSTSNIESADPRAVSRQFIVRVSTSSTKRTEDKSHVISKTEVLGRLSHVLAFPGISDWQYLSDSSLTAANRRFDINAPKLVDPYCDAPDRIPTKFAYKSGRECSSWRPPSTVETRARRAMNIISLISLGKCPPPESTVPVSSADNNDTNDDSAALNNRNDESDCDASHNFKGQSEVLELCRPWRFSRTGTEFVHHTYLFQQHSYSRSQLAPTPFLLGCDRRSDALRLISKPWKVPSDSVEVPQRPPSPNSLRVIDENGRPIIPRRMRNRELLAEKLQGAFQECPVWLRRSVLQRARPQLRSSFSQTIRMVAYSFYGAGPFSQAWVRYGYDPRGTREARQYQVVDLRINNPVSMEAIKVQYAQRKAHIPKHERVYAWTADYSLSEVPTYKHLFLQLRDLEIPEVKKLLKEEPYPEKFDAKVGFFTEEGYKRVLKAIRKRIYEMSFKMLGAKRAKYIMDEFMRLRRLRKSKRKRKNFFVESAITPLRRRTTKMPEAVTINAAGQVSVVEKDAPGSGNSVSRGPTQPKTKIDVSEDEKRVPDNSNGDGEGGESDGSGGERQYDERLLNFEEVEAFELVGDDDDVDEDEDEDMDDYDDGEMEGGDGSDEM